MAGANRPMQAFGGQMKKTISLVALLWLAGCGGGNFVQNLNPLNWFGGGSGVRSVNGQPSLAPRRGYSAPVETRALAQNASQARIERTPSGIIVKVEVAIPASGYDGVDLVERRDAPPGILILEARLNGASGPVAGQVTAARFVSTEQLRRISEIQIRSQSGTLSLRP